MLTYATTSSSILLKYLEVKSNGGNRLALQEVLKEFMEIEDRFFEIKLYDFIESDASKNPQFRQDLETLKAFRFVDYSLENPHVEITELGKFFAGIFELPPPIGEYLADKKQNR